MLRRFLESSVLFIHVIRWFFIATAVGVIVGLSSTAFLLALDGAVDLAGRWNWYQLLHQRGVLLSILERAVLPDGD